MTPQQHATALAESWIKEWKDREWNPEARRNLEERIFGLELLAMTCQWKGLDKKLMQFREDSYNARQSKQHPT